MGNSEVGHNALGAGRVFEQGAKLVNDAIASGAIFRGAAWRQIARPREGWRHACTSSACSRTATSTATSTHLFAMLDRCATGGFPRVRVHPLLDGRDVGEKSALTYLEPLEQKLAALGAGGRDYRIASGGGRMVTTMDRYDANWEVVERGLEGARARRRPAVFLGRRSGPHLLRRGPVGDGPVPRQLRRRRQRQARRNDRRWRRRDLLQLPRRPGHRDLAGVRGGGLPRVRPRAPSRRVLRGHDGIRRRREDPEELPRRAAGDRPDHRPVPVRRGRHVVRDLGDAEVRARHVFLERQQLRLHRRGARELRRDPVGQGARSTSGRG